MAKKQADLPGMEDKHIREIEDAAHEYAEARDKRMKLTEKEVEKKGELLAAMQKHKKRHYEVDDLQIDIEVEKETVKVRIRKVEEEEDAA